MALALLMKCHANSASRPEDKKGRTPYKMQGCGMLAPVVCRVPPIAICFFVRIMPAGCFKHDCAPDEEVPWGGVLPVSILGGLSTEEGEYMFVLSRTVCTSFWCDLEICQVA